MTRDRIFSAAKTVLDREGASGLTIRKVAARAGTSPMAMYRHFAGKEALLNALVEDGFAAWEKIVRSIKARDPVEWLGELMEAFLEFALAQPHRFDAAFFLPAPNVRRYPDDFAAGRSPVVAMMMVRIEQAKADGRLRDKPALQLILALAGLAQGLVSMQRAKRFTSERQFRQFYRTALGHCLDSFSVTRSRSAR